MAFGLSLNWRDELVSASFRGAEFYVLKSSALFGRVVRLQKFWGSDYNYIEDLGAATDEFTIEGYVIANSDNDFNYFLERDLLIQALKDGVAGSDNYIIPAYNGQYNPNTKQTPAGSGGNYGKPGTLKHPFYGELKVYLKEPAKVEESFEEGGIARFQMTFINWDAGQPPKSFLSSYKTLVDTSALKAFNAAIDTFNQYMTLGGAFVNALGNVMKTAIQGISNALGSIRGAIASTISGALGITANALNFADTILGTPCAIATNIGLGVDSVLSVCGMAGQVVQGGVVGGCSGELRGSIYQLDGNSIPERLTVSAVRALLSASTTSEEDVANIPQEQEDNAIYMMDMFQVMCLINACKIAIRGLYANQTTAQDCLDLILEYIDAYLLRIGERSIDNSIIIQAVDDLRNTFKTGMSDLIESLKRVIEYTVPPDGMNTLVLAYQKYNNIYRSDEIYSMNIPVVEHPGILPEGTTISTLDS